MTETATLMEGTYIPLLSRLGIETDKINALHWVGVILCIVLLFYISGLICSKIIIPITNRLTKKNAFQMG